MSPVFSARRRADEFHALVEGHAPQADLRHGELLELVAALRALPEVEPRAEFVSDLRERLLAEAPAALAQSGPSLTLGNDRRTVPERRIRRERRIATAVGGFALVGASTSMAVAAQSALPGDVLYPLKRAIENARTGLSVDDQQKGHTLLANATDRLDEVERLSLRFTAESTEDVEAIEETLSAFSDQAAEASDLLLAEYEASGDQRPVEELQDFTAESFDALTQLDAVLPEEARDALVSAGNVLAGIEAQIRFVCPTCEVRPGEVPQWLLAQAGTLGEGLLAPGLAPGGTLADETPSAGEKPADAPKGGKDGPQSAPSDDPLGDLVGDGASSPGSTDGSGPQDGGGPGSGSKTGDTVGDLIQTLTGGGKGNAGAGSGSQTDGPLVGDVLDGASGLLGPTPAP